MPHSVYWNVFFRLMIPRSMNFMCRCFETLCSIFIGAYEDGTECSETSNIKFRCSGITQKKEYNIQSTVRISNQEISKCRHTLKFPLRSLEDDCLIRGWSNYFLRGYRIYWHRPHWYTLGPDSVTASYPEYLRALMTQIVGPVKHQCSSARLHDVSSPETLILVQYRTNIWDSRFLWNVSSVLQDYTKSIRRKN